MCAARRARSFGGSLHEEDPMRYKLIAAALAAAFAGAAMAETCLSPTSRRGAAPRR
jgi:hypothetical protein